MSPDHRKNTHLDSTTTCTRYYLNYRIIDALIFLKQPNNHRPFHFPFKCKEETRNLELWAKAILKKMKVKSRYSLTLTWVIIKIL